MGPIGLDEALAMAEEKGFDLVEVSPGAKPPVVKMMDYGKYKYEQQKKAAEARKRQKVIEIKEIKMRPSIDVHDYEVKMRSMKRFFDDGDKVKVTLRFRGREMAHQNIGMELLTRIQKETDGFAKIEQYPKLEGRQMMMVLAPR
ncbi:MAG: translation initiation factor [Alphaproteobacteria bacterium]|jgi:translation initiation factor IF-3|nr:translation initiation factor [Alphaproteobacteria bacterium]